MNCRFVQEWIADLLADRLSPEEARRCESHLRECPDCRRELERVREVWAALGELPEREPGPGVRSRFYAMLEEETRRVGRATHKPWRQSVEDWIGSWWPHRPLGQVAAAVFLLLVGLVAGSRFQSGPGPNGEVADLRVEVAQMRQLVSLSLLKQESSSERLRGVNLSTRVRQPSRELLSTLTRTLETDPNENVRLAAIDALSLFRSEPGVVDALTSALVQESSPLVQIALIDVVTATQERNALDTLRKFLEERDVNPAVKEHAEIRISDYM